jgi:hypothetical protein
MRDAQQRNMMMEAALMHRLTWEGLHVKQVIALANNCTFMVFWER